MDLETRSPYWDAIVGDNWPSISPTVLRALAASIRYGSVPDTDGVEQAWREFADRGRSSMGLQPIKNDMWAQTNDSRAVADALSMTADVLGDSADLVEETRNRILDCVDHATHSIRAIVRPAAGSTADSDTASLVRDQLFHIISRAGIDVANAVNDALAVHSLSSRKLGEIAVLLGVPSLGGAGGSAQAGAAGPIDHSSTTPAEPSEMTTTPTLFAVPSRVSEAIAASRSTNNSYPEAAELSRTPTTPAASFIVGEQADGDLILARRLLAGVLATADSPPVGFGIAVSMMRHSDGVKAFVTSNDGRGWLPRGVLLPRQVSMPWSWSGVDSAVWEGFSDPARVLAEFGLVWGQQFGAHLTALASSQRITPSLRRQIGHVPVDERVTGTPESDPLTAGADQVDRLGLLITQRYPNRAAAVSETLIGHRCLEMAWDANALVSSMVADSVELLGTRGLRERILSALRDDRRPIPDRWWDELRDIDDLLAATTILRRIDTERIPLGEIRDSPDALADLNAMRALSFQRRCNELVLLLSEKPSQQLFRDVAYTHIHVVDHPSFRNRNVAARNAGPASVIVKSPIE
ncbi:hypothetical protein [Nocardia sp. CDC160]|uniref:hypothetical protein n=1 Tax=Nocardia sp. CDC160 TaxID=3112166 RepID=UPI002DBFAE45|nr:hypothetical protein [Nocardia sp. CDC160]MEC3920204.1 hypothetical protein [Nocardia sp. CDC160]